MSVRGDGTRRGGGLRFRVSASRVACRRSQALASEITSKPPHDLQERPGLGVVAIVDGQRAVLGRRRWLEDLDIDTGSEDGEDVSQVWVAHGR